MLHGLLAQLKRANAQQIKPIDVLNGRFHSHHSAAIIQGKTDKADKISPAQCSKPSNRRFECSGSFALVIDSTSWQSLWNLLFPDETIFAFLCMMRWRQAEECDDPRHCMGQGGEEDFCDWQILALHFWDPAEAPSRTSKTWIPWDGETEVHHMKCIGNRFWANFLNKALPCWQKSSKNPPGQCLWLTGNTQTDLDLAFSWITLLATRRLWH